MTCRKVYFAPKKMSTNLSKEEIDRRKAITYTNRNGYSFKIIDYKTSRNVTIQFEDGKIKENVYYGHIVNGKVGYPNSHIRKDLIDKWVGATKVNNKGYLMKIISYNGVNDIDVEFEDGEIVEHVLLKSFKRGTLLHPKCMNLQKGEFDRRMNMEVTNAANRKMKILNYRSVSDIDVIFDDGVIKEHCLYHEFKHGGILHPNDINNQWRRKEDEEYLIDKIYGQYKKGAKERNLAFDLSKNKFGYLIFQRCYYCGCIESNIREIKKYKTNEIDRVLKYNGIDRIDNTMGYVESNVVPCCKTCNIAKHTMTQNDFYTWIQSVSENFTKDKIRK